MHLVVLDSRAVAKSRTTENEIARWPDFRKPKVIGVCRTDTKQKEELVSTNPSFCSLN